MIPVDQRESDDCLRACIASVFEIPWEDAPDTGAGCRVETRAHNQHNVVVEWLKARGLTHWMIEMQPADAPVLRRGIRCLEDGSREPADFVWPSPPVSYYLGGGPSPRDPAKDHAVVMYGGRIVHDPNPARDMTIDRIRSITVFIALLNGERV